jgi:hypothetical protein
MNSAGLSLAQRDRLQRRALAVGVLALALSVWGAWDGSSAVFSLRFARLSVLDHAAPREEGKSDARGKRVGYGSRLSAFFRASLDDVAARVDTLFFFLLGVAAFFASLIFFPVIFFAGRYRRRRNTRLKPGNSLSQIVERG